MHPTNYEWIGCTLLHEYFIALHSYNVRLTILGTLLRFGYMQTSSVSVWRNRGSGNNSKEYKKKKQQQAHRSQSVGLFNLVQIPGGLWNLQICNNVTVLLTLVIVSACVYVCACVCVCEHAIVIRAIRWNLLSHNIADLWFIYYIFKFVAEISQHITQNNGFIFPARLHVGKATFYSNIPLALCANVCMSNTISTPDQLNCSQFLSKILQQFSNYAEQ